MLGAVSLDLFAVLLGGATALLPIFAKDILHVGPWGLGLLRGAPAVGALVMSLALTRWPMRRRTGHAAARPWRVYGVRDAGVRLSTAFVLSLAALAVSGAADMVSVVIRQTLVQLETPDDDARTRQRGQLGVHRRVEPARRIRVGRHRRMARAGGLGGARRNRDLLIAALWRRLFPALARRDQLVLARDATAVVGDRGTTPATSAGRNDAGSPLEP